MTGGAEATTPAPLAGYVLAGGASRRFGRDKAAILFGGQTMLERMRDLLAGVAGDVSVVAPPGRYEGRGVPCIADRWPGEGPLGGVLTALLNSAESRADREWNLILSCDMPFLTKEWLTFLAQRAEASDALVLYPQSAHGPEPLCACWRTSAQPALQAAFDRGARKMTDALKNVPAEVLDERVWKRFDSEGRLFWNMNTPADYEEALRVWGETHA